LSREVPEGRKNKIFRFSCTFGVKNWLKMFKN
jgi:hypothetical protein